MSDHHDGGSANGREHAGEPPRAMASGLNGRPVKRRAGRRSLPPLPAAADPAMDARPLARLIADELIPRLMLAHGPARTDRSPSADAPGLVIDAAAVEAFANQALTGDAHDLMTTLEAHRAAGATTQTLYLCLLAPVARRLGALWEEDRCTFTEVTLALGHLQTLLHRLGHDDAATRPVAAARQPCALFLNAPGEQHSFGLLMVDELFRQHGWRTLCQPQADLAEARALAGGQWCDVIGVGVSCEAHVAAAAETVAAVRASSLNPDAIIMIGGGVFATDPALGERVGADLVDVDGMKALSIAKAAGIATPLSA
jgi:methanogenic corrinoid protein MtbC1